MNYKEWARKLSLSKAQTHTYGNNTHTHIYNKTDTTPHLVISDPHPESGIYGSTVDRSLVSRAFEMLNPELHSFDDSHVFSINNPTPGQNNNYSPEGHIFYDPNYIVNKHVYTFNKPKSGTSIITPDNFSNTQKLGHIIQGVTHPGYLDKFFTHKLKSGTPIGIIHENIIHGDYNKDELEHLQEVKDEITKNVRKWAEGFIGDEDLREKFANYLHNELKYNQNYPDIIKVLTGIDKL